METSLLRVLPACLTEPLPVGWEEAPQGYIIEIMPEVERPEVAALSVQMTEPDVLLLDADFPGIDAFAVAAQVIEVRPGLAVIIIAKGSEPDSLRRAMLAGAEEYLTRPLTAAILRESLVAVASTRTLRSAESEALAPEEETGGGQIVGVVSGKGGLGKTTIAVNLAALVAKLSGKPTGLVGLESGDGAVMLSLQPRLGLLDLAGAGKDEAIDSAEWIKQFGIQHKSGLFYWAWQGLNTQPGAALPDDFFENLFESLRRMNSVTIIDFPLLSADEVQAVLPLLDIVILVSSSSDLLALRSTKTFLDTVPAEISQRVRIVINRADPTDMINRDDFEQTLEQRVAAVLPNQPHTAAEAINMGSPFVLTQAQSELAVNLKELAQSLLKLQVADSSNRPKRRFKLFGG